MTVTATNAYNTAIGNGAAVSFPFTFFAMDASEVSVYLDGTLQTVGFTVTLDADHSGGTVAFDTAPANGVGVVIASNPAFTQNTSFENAGAFLATAHDNALDRDAIRLIWLKDQVSRALRSPVGENSLGYLPAAADRANLYLMFDAAGNPTVGNQTGATGAPGGNVMSIGLFTDASTLTIAVGTDLVQTSGYSTTSVGHARYGYDAAVDAAYVVANPYTSFLSANGRGFRIVEPIVTPFHFGAAGDNVTDDLAALQAFNDWFFAQDRKHYADWNGTFGLSGNLTIGPPVKTSTRWNVGGRPWFTMLNATFECIRLRGLSNMVWHGSMRVTGIGGVTFASRTCGVGFCLEDCDRLEIEALHAENLWFSGITYDPTANSNGAMIGIIKATNCGSGHNYSGAGNGLTGNWSAAVNTGTSGSTGQKTTITVDALPNAAITTYRPLNSNQLHVRINGYLYFVSAIDRVANTVSIFPWIDPAAGASGTFEWVFGGAHEPVGSNANVVRVGLLDAIRCGKGAAEAAIYCSRYGSTILNQCGVHVMVGEDPSASSIGLSIDALYIEGGGSGEHIVVAHRFGNANNSHYVGTTYQLDLSKCYNVADARVTAGTISGGELGTVGNLTGFTIGHKGKYLCQIKQNLTHAYGSTAGLFGQATPPIPQIIQRDSHTLTLQVVGSGEYNRLFGFSGGIVGYIGTGTNGAPTGSFTFNPPAGGTVNGGAVGVGVTFSGFTGPVLFLYEHTDTAQLTWKVRPLGGALRAATSSATYSAPAAMTYAAPAGGATVDAEGRASLAQLAADVTSIRTKLIALAADDADIKAKLQAVGLMA